MKKIANLIGLMLAAAFARADVTSATEWQDVPPDMTLGAVAEGAGLAKAGDCARAVAQEAKDRAAAIAALTSALAKVATSGSYADLSNKPTIPTISATDETFSNAVLQVGIGTLGITTNDLQVVHDLAELPVGTSITTVGGLLAALAAGLAALKKSVSSLSSKVDDANAALEEVA